MGLVLHSGNFVNPCQAFWRVLRLQSAQPHEARLVAASRPHESRIKVSDKCFFFFTTKVWKGFDRPGQRTRLVVAAARLPRGLHAPPPGVGNTPADVGLPLGLRRAS